MREFIDPQDRQSRLAPTYLQERMKQYLEEGKKRQYLRIIWDKADGYPDHAWGYIQWSIRPYEQRYGCDGTVDPNINLIGLRLCEQLGLDYKSLYRRAYLEHDGNRYYEEDWIDYLSEFEGETIIPELSERSLRSLLNDLQSINMPSMIGVLKTEFERLGYSMANWWED